MSFIFYLLLGFVTVAFMEVCVYLWRLVAEPNAYLFINSSGKVDSDDAAFATLCVLLWPVALGLVCACVCFSIGIWLIKEGLEFIGGLLK